MTLTYLLIVSMAAAFVTSFVDQWLPSGVWRGLVALVASALGMLYLGVFSLGMGTLMSFASAFGTLILILVGERLATPQPFALDSRRR